MTYEHLLLDLARRDERIIVMTAENRAAIRNLPAELGDRFIDVGIAEQTMIGAAAGLALRGRIPVTHALSAFLTLRAFEFVRTDVGIPALPVKLVGGVPGLLSEANGPTHQAIEDVALMRGIPSMNVFAPADVEEMLAGLEEVILHPEPFYVRFNGVAAEHEHPTPFRIGVAEQIGHGTDVTLLVYGFLFNEAMRTRALLAERGIDARVLNLRTVKPLDAEAILRCAAETDLLVTIEDHFLVGGLRSIVGELLLEERFTTPVHSIGFRDRWFRPGLLRDVMEYEGMTAEQMSEEIATVRASRAPLSTSQQIA